MSYNFVCDMANSTSVFLAKDKCTCTCTCTCNCDELNSMLTRAAAAGAAGGGASTSNAIGTPQNVSFLQ